MPAALANDELITHSKVRSLWREVWDGAVPVGLLEVQRVALQVQLREDCSPVMTLSIIPSEEVDMCAHACLPTVLRQCSMERGASWECSSRRL